MGVVIGNRFSEMVKGEVVQDRENVEVEMAGIMEKYFGISV